MFGFTRSVKCKSIFDLTDQDLLERFGEDGCQYAKGYIQEKRYKIASGFSPDWDKVRESWDKRQMLSDPQLAVLEGHGIEGADRYTKYQASFLIDDILLEQFVLWQKDCDIRERKRRAEREAKKAQEAAEKEKRRQEREHARMLARQLKEQERERKRTEREQQKIEEKIRRENEKFERKQARLKAHEQGMSYITLEKLELWKCEFTTLWNGILNDDKIDIVEVEIMKNWLRSHKRKADDFDSVFRIIESVCADGTIDEYEMQLLYDAAVSVINSFGQ